MFQKDLGLEDLVNLEEWKRLQDAFSDVLDLTLRTVSLNGELLTKTSHPNRLCAEIVPKKSHYSGCCNRCLLKKEVIDPFDIRQITNFKCQAGIGLDIFTVPISAVSDIIVAYIIAGPLILESRKSQSDYAKDAKRLGIELDELTDALIEINVFTHNKVYSITRSIEQMFSHIAQAGYHKKRLGEIRPAIIEMDPLFSRYYEEKVLNALLNLCTLALDADSGSVMTVDRNTKTLHIKVSSKLNEDAVNNPNLKVGEGIAGLAAATAKPIILPKEEDKSGLSGKLMRRYIKSSMVIPFNAGNSHDVYGVINLNIVRKDKDFSEKDIALVKELVNLAGLALIPVKK